MLPYINGLLLRGQSLFKNIPKRFYSDHERVDLTKHKVNNLEKKFLVWTGKYKNLADVPDYVGQAVVEHARNKMRIRIANYMIAATVIGCLVMVFSGKRAASRGESVQKQNLEWHRRVKEEDAKNEK